ncbi:ABC transporter ATP-binding protein [Mesorhizobium hungaricum]|jgi:branched-chain amino acid transport system ATP-binding protein|uniref:ABC transporter ATP-binding protein n=1 Tax=Mesorhizobium hungaricum TaxID=1566387 RepID=A0A1C2E396_9HYPH|nr:MULTISPECIES: ABC transporter ATP-binding protein [Mesorhizobium]MBN9235807.1 ABC transporter ATP-binding protein [Mesorhizobium sp.]MDQ0333099.1 branched-chain amino acid transport system ATP-binding protein [Mesorhizobium sp. YL-MeA3-2017]OCX21469.1 ABC transporter ATP-binding protein [Mesorhizobium hungaricum]
MTEMLKVSDVSVAYGRMTAVRNVSLSIDNGSISVIVGPNGAGKSTILRAIAGGIKPSKGHIEFDGQTIVGRRPEDLAASGISLVPEGRHVFPTLTVRENLLVASHVVRDRAGSLNDMERLLQLFPRLRERFSQTAGKLSGGEQQMLVIARALMTRPRLLLVDEPSLGLAPKIVDEVYELLLELRRERGLTLLINEQTSKRVLKFAETVYVLRDGSIRLKGSAQQLRLGTALSDAYFGSVSHHEAWTEEVDS